MNKTDCGTVPQFPFPGNPEPVYTGGDVYCHELGTSLLGRLQVCFFHVFFSFETTLFFYNLPVIFLALTLKLEQ